MLPRDGSVAIKRRQDYRPPAFLIDEIELALDLVPDATRVTTRLAFHRNPQAHDGDRASPLVLDGEQQDDVEVDLDGATLARDRYVLTPETLTVLDPPSAGTLTV